MSVAQSWLQLPQFSGSFCVLIHAPLQSVMPLWHTHWPPLQTMSCTVHGLLHPPQLLMSVSVLTHASLQTTPLSGQ